MKTVSEQLELPGTIEHPGHEFVLSVMLTSRMLSSAARDLLRPFDLTEAHFHILMLLKHQLREGTSQVGLSRRMLVNRANVTGLIDRLANDGLVERKSMKGDRRSNLVVITDAGLAKLGPAETAYLAAISRVAAALPEPDRANVVQALLSVCGFLTEHGTGN